MSLYKVHSALLSDLTNFLNNEIGRAGPQFSQELAPGASPLQQRAFQLAEQFGAGDPAREAAMARLLGGETSFVPDSGETEAFYQANIGAPLAREYERSLDQIDQRMALRGLGDSGVRARALTDAHRNFLDTSRAARTDLAYRDLSAMRASRESALNRLGPAIAQSLGMDTARISILGGVGDVQREIDSQQRQDTYRRFLEAQPLYNPALQMIGGPIQQPAPKSPKAQPVWPQLVQSAINPLQGFFGGGM